MSTAPIPYDRVVSFFSYEATYPSLPKRGADLDAEFNAVEAAIDATQSRLAEIQRDDGLLGNNTVHPQAITQELYTLLGSDYEPRGSWLTATLYDPGDLIERLGLNYLAIITHVSGDFDIDLANGKWQAFGGYPNAAQVVFSPSGSIAATNVQAALQELDGDIQGKQSGSANLSALSGLAGAPDRVPYFTGAGAMTWAEFTLAGRALVAADSPASQRAILELVKGTAAGNIVELDGSAKLPAVDGSQLTDVVPALLSVDETRLAAVLNLSGKSITMPPALTPVFTKAYESPQQVITSAGALTLAHGLGVKPKFVQVVLVCLIAENGYSIGDEVFLSAGLASGATTDRGLSIVPDATNINLRYGSAASSFALNHKTSGLSNGCTNANWRLVIRAYA